jgi:hypothetical protein
MMGGIIQKIHVRCGWSALDGSVSSTSLSKGDRSGLTLNYDW